MTNQMFDDYKLQYQQMHSKGNFAGNSLKLSYVPKIKLLVEKTGSKTVLDFGCGKASSYKGDNPINLQFGISSENMAFYDIGVREYEVLPKNTFDGVISTDVLEHVPEELVEDAIETIFLKSSKFVFLVIHCGLAVKVLPNGQNAHVTIKPPAWWNNKLKKHFTKDKIVHTSYSIPADPKYNILGL